MGRLVRLPKQATDSDLQLAGMMESVLPLGGIQTLRDLASGLFDRVRVVRQRQL